MIKFIYFTLIIYSLHASSLKASSPSFVNPKNLTSNDTSKSNFISLKSNNDFTCSSSTEIQSITFSDLVQIKSDTGCQSISIKKCNFEKIAINPENSQSNGQLSIIYIKNSDLFIEDSTFHECFSKSQISSTLIENSESKFLTCHAIYIDENRNNEATINNCNFLDNGLTDETAGTIIFSQKAKKIEILFSNFQCEQRFTRAIQTVDTSIVTLSSVTFSGCVSTDTSGSAICIESSTFSSADFQLFGCTFLNCYTSMKGGGAIAVTVSKSVQIEDCYIENCRVENEDSEKDIKGGSILINFSEKSDSSLHLYLTNLTVNGTITNTDFSAVCVDCSATISEFFVRDCKFINCKTRCFLGESYNVLACPKTVEQFEVINSSFIFDEKSASNPRAVHVGSSSFTFDNCTFVRCGSESISEGGCIFFDGITSNEVISIDNCIFEECYASHSGAVRLKLNTSSVPHFSNNSVINFATNFSISVEYKNPDLTKTVIFEGHKFIGNTGSFDGGSSGIFVSNYYESEEVFLVDLQFIRCEFVDNNSPSFGGGFGVGYNDTVKPTKLLFESCLFSGNRCDGTDGGGALWVRTSSPCSIVNCVFVNNSSSESGASNGGAIYLSFTSTLVMMTISDCSFVNNSCLFGRSKGHCIYATLLYGIIEIYRCNFTDNGYGIEDPNCIIYTRSALGIYDSLIEFSSKENTCTRAIYIGGSSNLTMGGNKIVNCSYQAGSGAALYYESVKNRKSDPVVIYGNTFINNTSSETGSEMYFYISESPLIRNCSFYDEDCKFELIFIKYGTSSSRSYKLDGFHFYNCNLNNYQVIPYTYDYNSNPVIYTDCRYISCSNIQFSFNNAYSVEFSNCVFYENVNENFFINIQYVRAVTMIQCDFTNNTLIANAASSYDGKVDLFMIKIDQIPFRIQSTIFSNIIIQDEKDEVADSFIIKIDGNLNMFDTTMINCSSFKNAIYFNPPIRPVYDEELGIYYPNTFEMFDCVVDNCGLVSINDWTQQVNVYNSLFANSVNGLTYWTLRPIYDYLVSDTSEFENNVFDSFTNVACSFTVIYDIYIRNITVKNCQSDCETCFPIFKLDVKSKIISHVTFEEFTFENNRYNNSDDKIWMNGGGSGFVLDLACMNLENQTDVILEFVDCKFASNQAECNGGVLAINDTLKDSITFLNLLNCIFKDNKCNNHEGNSLYLDVKNLSIENCIFESNEKNNNEVYLQSASDFEDSSKMFSFINCTFLCKYERSIHIHNCDKEVNILRSTFSHEKSAVYLDECSGNVNIHNCLFEIAGSCSIHVQTTASLSVADVHYKESKQQKAADYAIEVDCSHSLSIRDSVLNSGGVFIDPKSGISGEIKVTKVTFKSANCGFFFEPSSEVPPQPSLLFTNCVFSSLKTALKLSITSGKFTFKGNTICDCVNLDASKDKPPIIELKLNSPESSSRVLFEDVKFERNKFFKPTELTSGFSGGIGLNVLAQRSGQFADIEFVRCSFVSNEATDGKASQSGSDTHSGGCFYYVENDDFKLSSLTFVSCTFHHNFALGKGGVAYIEASTGCSVLFSRCSLVMNRAIVDAGALFVKNGNRLAIEFSDLVNNSATQSGTDALAVAPSADVTITATRFITSVPQNAATGVQLSISLPSSRAKRVSVSVSESIFTVINPTKSAVFLKNNDANSEISLVNNSFTHFFFRDGKVSNQPLSAFFLADSFVPILIDSTLSGRITISNSCFDAYNAYAMSSAGGGEKSDLVTENQNLLRSYECKRPSEIDAVLEIVYDESPSPSEAPQDENSSNKKKYVMIGVIVAVVAVVIVVVIIVVVVVVRKKKRKMKMMREGKSEEEGEKETDDENEMNGKFIYPTMAMTQENPLFTLAAVNNIENFSEEPSTEGYEAKKVE